MKDIITEDELDAYMYTDDEIVVRLAKEVKRLRGELRKKGALAGRDGPPTVVHDMGQ